MSIASQLTTLAANKVAIKAAIEAKSPATAPTDALAQWPTAIASIPSGGGLTGYTLRLINNGDQSGSDFADQVGKVLKADGTTETTDFYGTGTSLKIVNNAIAYAGGNTNYSVLNVLTGNTVVKVSVRCFVAGTKIILCNGSVKNVEDIGYEDELLTWDFGSGKPSSAKPLWIKKREEVNYAFTNKFASGRVLRTTGRSKTGWAHRGFNVTRGSFTYFPASVGDEFFSLDGNDELVESRKTMERVCSYNIITVDHMNLFAEGILTSCSLNNYRGFNAAQMTWASKAVKHHSRSAFDGIPNEWIDGLHLCEQPIAAGELAKYVKGLVASDTRLRA